MKRLLIIVLTMLQFFGCTAKGREGLTYLYFERHNTMIADGARYWKAELVDDETAVVTLKREGCEPISYNTSPSVLLRLNAIVNKYKMYRYKGDYITRFDVSDGSTWDFDLKYSDGRTTHTHGFMKYPKDARDAFEEVSELLEKWLVIPDNSRMNSFSFSVSNGMIMNYGANYSVRIDWEGKVRIVINEFRKDERFIETDYYQIFDDLQQIVMKYGMYAWKENYEPPCEVTDGTNWSFGAGYEDGTYLRSYGYVEMPDGFSEVRGAIDHYFKPWRFIPLKDGKVTAAEVEAFYASFDWSTPLPFEEY